MAKNASLPAGYVFSSEVYKKMAILIAYEESQTICKAYREKGIEAYSCDLKHPSGGKPQWHIRQDAIKTILSNTWDIIIMHPPCTYTSLSGNRWYHNSPKRTESLQYIKELWEIAQQQSNKIALEQPMSVTTQILGKPTQKIHPWEYGHEENKETWLWLNGLPQLKPTNIMETRINKIWKMPPGPQRKLLRSKTYEGIAKAITDQWI